MIRKFKFESSSAPSCVITEASAGNMGSNINLVEANRKIILDKLNTGRIFILNQKHTDIVYDVSEIKDKDDIFEGDGLITCGSEVLSVTAADCLPVFLWDPVNQVYGVVHSGWKGTGIAVKALEKMAEKYKTAPEDVEVIIGPSISSCCYSVDKNRAEHFAGKWGKQFVKEINSAYYLDLQKTNESILTQAGVKKIQTSGICTSCNNNFFSYRRQGEKDFGLMLALIGYFL